MLNRSPKQMYTGRRHIYKLALRMKVPNVHLGSSIFFKRAQKTNSTIALVFFISCISQILAHAWSVMPSNIGEQELSHCPRQESPTRHTHEFLGLTSTPHHEWVTTNYREILLLLSILTENLHRITDECLRSTEARWWMPSATLPKGISILGLPTIPHRNLFQRGTFPLLCRGVPRLLFLENVSGA